VLANSSFTVASPGNTYIEWLCCYSPENSPTAKSSSQEPRTVSFWSKLHTPSPICRGCTLPLSRPLHSQTSGSPFGTNSIEKGHVSGALFSPTDLTQRLLVAIRMSRTTKKIAINTYLIYTELFYGRNNVFKLRIHLINKNTWTRFKAETPSS
jgi:hypothetical protein